MKTWQGRIQAPADGLFESFTSSIVQDQRLAPYDIRVSKAHARALARAHVISDRGAERLVEALDTIGAEIEAHEFAWRDELEDVHTHIESRLRDLLGPLADTLHAGRSRNDQVAADLRLYVMDRAGEARSAITGLQSAFLALAEQYNTAIMPGYTHLQQAQPLLIAQPLLAYIAMLDRDWNRFGNVLERASFSPLGSGALAGSAYPLDREFLARECGFSGVIANSLDAVSDRDFLIEFVVAAGLCMTHLSRFAEDLIIWASSEFRFVRLPDAFASGSSMMPQKKNPDVPELVRGKAALVLGDVMASMVLIKGIPLGYNRDLQEDKTPLFHATDVLLPCLNILAAMVPRLEFDTERTESAISSFTLATDLADHLVHAGLPFREAHALVGGLVGKCLDEGRSLSDLSIEERQSASPLLQNIPELTPRASISLKQTSGSTHPDAVREQLERVRVELNEPSRERQS
ncbi:MAG: argininosuccinate lyase [Chloroflexota bacterium]